MTTPKRGQIVEVTWLDSTMRGRWDSEAQYLRWAKEAEGQPHRSVGYVMRSSKRSVVLVQSRSDYADGYRSRSDAVSIPRCAVLGVKVFEAHPDAQGREISEIERAEKVIEAARIVCAVVSVAGEGFLPSVDELASALAALEGKP